jgi:hypothetical protein
MPREKLDLTVDAQLAPPAPENFSTPGLARNTGRRRPRLPPDLVTSFTRSSLKADVRAPLALSEPRSRAVRTWNLRRAWFSASHFQDERSLLHWRRSRIPGPGFPAE